MIQNSNVALQLWSEYKQKFAGPYMQMLKSGELTLNGRTMHFIYREKGDKPKNGYSLIFGFHGGGQTTPEANDKQWGNHKVLYNNKLPSGVIWFAPRSIENKSDMWHRDYMEDFILEVIRAFATNDMIDVNKVFLTGYSAGGDGIYHMAPRMADFLAGAAMMAGHPNAINFMNIRNIGFSIQVGGNDSAYNRNLEGIKYIRMLNQLGQNYGGYKHQSKIHEGKPHWMNLEDGDVFPWLFDFTRNPYPNLILYKQCRARPKQTFYYIRLGQAKNGNRDEEVVVIKENNTFKIISNRTISIMVNSHMVNVSQPIKIIHNKATTVERMIQPRVQVAQKTFFERIDPYYVFEDEFQSVPPQIIDVKQAICEHFYIDPSQKEAQYERQLSFKPEEVPANFNRNLNPPPRKKKTLAPPPQEQEIYSSGHEEVERQNHIENYNWPGQGVAIGGNSANPAQQQRLARQQMHAFNPNEPTTNNVNTNNNSGASQPATRYPNRCADDCCSIF